jgi:type II secretory pathway pseudopilin PulG
MGQAMSLAMVNKASLDLRVARLAAFSVVEVLVVVGAIGVIAAVLIPSIVNVMKSASDEAAAANLEILNHAVLKYNHAVSEITRSADSGFSDEQDVMGLLKTRDALVPGSPFLNPGTSAVESEDEETYRAAWNGRMFQLVEPGQQATGLHLMKMNSQ